MMLLLLSVLLASAQEAAAVEVVAQPMGDFWAALAGGGGGAVTAGSAAFWLLKRVVGTIVDERCSAMQAAVEAMRARLQALEEASAAPSSSVAEYAALAQRVGTNETAISRLDGRADNMQALRAEHGALLARLREDVNEQRREARKENREIRADLASRLDRLADRIGAAR